MAAVNRPVPARPAPPVPLRPAQPAPARPAAAKATAAPAATPAPAKAPARAEIGTEFLYFIIENAYGFRGKHVIRLKDVGLVNVIGRNLETKSESSSGAGKSRVWRLFRYLIWGRVALKGVTESKSDMTVFGANFRLEIGFISRGQTYIIRETRKHEQFPDGLAVYNCPRGLNDKTRVAVGAENDPIRLRRYVQALINLTHDEACGTVIWPQAFGHTLIKGTPTERVQWLSDLNGLTQFDEIYEELSARSKAAKAEVGTLLEYRGEYNAVAEDMAQITASGSIDVVKERGRLLQTTITELDTKIKSTRDQQQALAARISSTNRLVDTVTATADLDLDSAEREMAIQGTLVRTFEEAASNVKTELQRLQQHSVNATRLTALRAQLAAVQVPENVAEMQERHTQLSSTTLPDLRREAALSSENEQDILVEQANLSQDVQDTETLLRIKLTQENIDAEIAAVTGHHTEVMTKLRDDQRQQQRVNQALSLNAGCECPTCLQEVTNREMLQGYSAKLVADIEAGKLQAQELSLHLQDLAKATALLGYINDIPQRLEYAQKAEAARDAIASVQAELTALAQQLREATANSRLIAERDVLVRSLESVDIGDVQAKTAELAAAVATHAETRDRYYAAQNMYDNVFAVAQELGVTDPFAVDCAEGLGDTQHEHDRLLGWLEQAQLRQRQNIAQLEQLRITVRTYASKSTHMAELQSKIDRLTFLEDELEVLASCMKAYGKTGMKVERLRLVMKHISDRLPVWTRVLFTEPYFKVKVDQDKSGTKLALLVTKQFTTEGGKTIVKWVDASALSGGEESRFAVCIMLTLSELVAPEKRTNLLVLDETDRSCDTFGQRLIADLLIPLMRKSRPSMFVITHQLQLNPEHVDAELVVTKHAAGFTDIKLEKPRRR